MTPAILIAYTLGSLVAFGTAWAVTYLCGIPFRNKYNIDHGVHKYLCCTFGMMAVFQWVLILIVGGL